MEQVEPPKSCDEKHGLYFFTCFQSVLIMQIHVYTSTHTFVHFRSCRHLHTLLVMQTHVYMSDHADTRTIPIMQTHVYTPTGTCVHSRSCRHAHTLLVMQTCVYFWSCRHACTLLGHVTLGHGGIMLPSICVHLCLGCYELAVLSL